MKNLLLFSFAALLLFAFTQKEEIVASGAALTEAVFTTNRTC